ncbi:hypothetical protein GF336_03615 [Candidatus Woesearchaeota archaeon]|nr:hypothetical protein [Candidatus Woesearchaeota archaeon]
MKYKKINYKIEKNEIEKVVNSTENEKHRFILTLLYKLKLSTGMIINLKIKDIRNNIMYCRGRRIYIPDSLMHDFYEHTLNRDKNEYLLKSNRDKKYNIRSIQEIRKKALKKCRLLKKA